MAADTLSTPQHALDPLDSKILWILDLNGRISMSDLARQVKQSQQIVSFRYHRLKKRKLIRRAITLVNLHLLGQLTFRVYFRLRQVTLEVEDALREHLRNRPDVLWFVQLSGGWDYEVVFRVRDYIEFARIWKSIQSEFGRFYERYDISMTTVTYHFRRDYLVKHSRREFATTKFGDVTHRVDLSENEIKLLNLLSQNARIKLASLQRQLKVSYSTVTQMIQHLEDSGVIQGYRMAPNTELLGRYYLKALIKLSYSGPESEEKLYRFCSEFPFVTYLTDVIGSWQFEIECEVSSHSEMQAMLKEVRRKFPELIQDYEIVQVNKEFVLRYAAEESTDD